MRDKIKSQSHNTSYRRKKDKQEHPKEDARGRIQASKKQYINGILLLVADIAMQSKT